MCWRNPPPATETLDMIPIAKGFAARAALVCFASHGLIASAQDPLAELDELLGGMTSLTADVSQLILESGGGLLEESRILLRLRKSGGFYWETLDPFPELIVTDGETLWNYQPDLEQVVIEDWDSGRSELAAQLLQGETGGLAETYRLRRINLGAGRRFELVPLAADNPYATIALEFVGHELDLIRLESRNGQQTVWRFSNLRRDTPLEDSLFVFAVPEGIEIVDNRAVQ